MATRLQWIREDAPRWDAGKQAMFGPAELAATGLAPPRAGGPVADEWWHVADPQGNVVGYGWLDAEWGDAQINFLVAADRRRAGIGEFIVDHLESEAAARGLNYIYNVVPPTSPNRQWVTDWLLRRGFVAESPAGDGNLRRRVHAGIVGPNG
ncbi:MAG: GNAT family N-acetyltransferase [Trebonia sp.]